MTACIIDEKLKVILTDTEIVKYNIDRVFFDKHSPNANKALALLFKAASLKAGFTAQATHFAIELYPVFDGGCEIYYIPSNDNLNYRSFASVKRFSVFEFSTADSLMSAVEALYLKGVENLSSGIYRLKNKYRMILSGGEAECYRLVARGFADRVYTSPIIRAKTLEYGTEVLANDAIETFGKAIVG